MEYILQNLLIGILGGLYSSLVVSRVFLIRSNLQEQIDYLREKFCYLGSLMAYFDVMEILLKTISDSRDELKEKIRRNPNYIKEADLVNVDEMMHELKTEILDKAIKNICEEGSPIVLKEKEYINLHREMYDSVKNFSNIKKITFKDVDEGKKLLAELNNKYKKCEKRRNSIFIKLLVRDVTIIVLLVVFILMLALYLSFPLQRHSSARNRLTGTGKEQK